MEKTGNFDERKIERLQKYLSVLRKIAGWSAEHLAEMLGVTRQTIVNLENSDTYKMTKMQYLAIRALLEAEVKRSHNITLGQVIEILVDDEDVSEDTKNKVQETVATAANSIGRRMGSAVVGTAVATALYPLLNTFALPFPTLDTLLFSREILKEAEKKREGKK